MELRPLGRTGVQVTKLCLGTMMFGAWGNTDHDDSIRIIHARAGRRHQLRRHRRRLLRRRVGGDRRQGAQGPPRRRRAGHQVLGPDGRRPQPRAASRGAGSSPRSRTRCGGSGTDWIDLYQIHRPDPDTDIDETLGALTDLVQQGKVRYIGSSSFSAGRDRRGAVGGARAAPGALPHRAAAVLAARPRHRARRPADGRAPRHGHPHLQPARRRLALGPLDRRRSPTSPARHRLAARFDMSLPENQRKLEATEQLARVAEDAGLSLIELAIAFVVNHPAVTSAIIGPRTMEQLESQLPAAEVVARRRGARPHRRDRPPGRQPQPRRHELRRAGAHAGRAAPVAARSLTADRRSGVQPERRVAIGDQDEGVRDDAVVPADHPLHVPEGSARVAAGEHDREPAAMTTATTPT